MVLVSGEAGMGKTSLVTAFCASVSRHVSVLWGSCEPLTTPVPLGVLHDMTTRSAAIADCLREGAGQHEVLAAVLSELGVPTVLVMEDLHWADDATLDLLRFLGRRVSVTPSVVVATYRSDEIADHPLQLVLGDLATTPAAHHVEVPPLTRDGVEAMTAGVALDADRVHRITGGNAFYVTEVLAGAPSWTVPRTVADAVLARVAKCPPRAGALLRTVSASPDGLGLDLLGKLHDGAADALDAAAGRGLLVARNGRVTFRHELARLAVYDSLPPGQRIAEHGRLLTALEDTGVPDPAALVHHAEAAGDTERVLRYAPAAAQVAAARGAHRVAAAHYGRAVAHADLLPWAERANLLIAWADQRDTFDEPEAFLALLRSIVDGAKREGDRLTEGAATSTLAKAIWSAGDGEEARRTALHAVDLLEPLGPGPELAQACAQLASISMLARETPQALRWGRRAVELAERFDAPKALAAALNAIGSSQIVCEEDIEGVEALQRSLDVAVRSGNDTAAAIALSNLGTGLGEVRRYGPAIRFLGEAITFAGDRDMDAVYGYDHSWLARVELETGRWDEAADDANTALRYRGKSPIIPIGALTVLARVRARRGDPGVDPLLDEAWALAVRTGDLQRLWPVAAALAEAAWLRGRTCEIPALVEEPLALARRLGVSWAVGELAFWAWRAEALRDVPQIAARPFRLQMSGDWRASAEAWSELGCPYERAEALAAGDEPAQRIALTILTELGASPGADRVRARMRQAGFSAVPPRPRASTSAAPAHLTGRQLEVLTLLGEGLSNAAIADQLYLSERTVGHHVSAVLRKLGVHSRAEAVARARSLGIEQTRK